MRRLQEQMPLRSLGKLPAPNPGRLILPFPRRLSSNLLHVLKSQGKQKSLTEAKLVLYISKAALSQPEMLNSYGLGFFFCCVLLAQGLIPAPGSRTKGCPAQGLGASRETESPACLQSSAKTGDKRPCKLKRKMPLGAENTGSGGDGQAVSHDGDTPT